MAMRTKSMSWEPVNKGAAKCSKGAVKTITDMGIVFDPPFASCRDAKAFYMSLQVEEFGKRNEPIEVMHKKVNTKVH